MNDTNDQSRSIILAAFMSFILPGFGQLYNGRWNRALCILLIFCASFMAFMGWATMAVPAKYAFYVFAASLGLCGLIWLASIIDAVLLSRKNQDYELRPWQTISVYIVVVLFAYIAVFKGVGGYTRTHIMEPFRIPSGSMKPGILQGDFIFADKQVNCKGCKRALRHGDVALFLYPKNRTQVFIKRIIGLPGDKIEVQGQSVFRNGKKLTTAEATLENGFTRVTERARKGAYDVQWSKNRKGRKSYEVPSGQVFVLGDNRNHSQDSRRYGNVPTSDVIGIAHHIWLSLDRNRDMRWSRLGMLIK
ncbi:MAG: signal peptidase I [Parasphingorhabdus sp.]|jgi:signal peptidase I